MRRLSTFVLFLAVGCAVNAFGNTAEAQSSAVTTCMMLCNSQSAACETTCLVPGTPPVGAATLSSNANVSTTCQLNCTTQQISCQSVCSRAPPPAPTAAPSPAPTTEVPAQ
jgi:hypothetical protein